MNSSSSQQKTEIICPYLGLLSDPLTAMQGSSMQNYCHRVPSPTAPDATHQRQFCLSSSHIQCELYTAKSPKIMPTAYRVDKERNIFKELPILRWLIPVLIFGLVVIVVILLNSSWLLPGFSPSPATAPLATTIPTPLSTVVVEPSATITNTPAPTATEKPTITPHNLHLLETPIGLERKYVIHQIAKGETLTKIASAFHTSVKAIFAANFNIEDLLYANKVIIIPINQMDITGINPMFAFSIKSDLTSIESLALEQDVNLYELCKLNGLPPDYVFQLNEWVILPYSPLPTSTP